VDNFFLKKFSTPCKRTHHHHKATTTTTTTARVVTSARGDTMLCGRAFFRGDAFFVVV
jgi:hypothetical protein